MKRIVAAVDGSATSLAAVDLAADLARQFNADLTLVAAIRDISGPDPGLEAYAQMEQIRDPLLSYMSAGADSMLTSARERALGRGAPHVGRDVRMGDPAEQVLAAAGERQADLIVCGSRGHGRITGLLVGSVAQKLLAGAACPVLVVPRAGD